MEKKVPNLESVKAAITSTSPWKYFSGSMSCANKLLQEHFDDISILVKVNSEGHLNPCKCEGIFHQSRTECM